MWACKKQCCPCLLKEPDRGEFDQDSFTNRMMTEGKGNWENELVKSIVGLFEEHKLPEAWVAWIWWW